MTLANQKLGQIELDRVIGMVGGPHKVADIYPLSPLQRGILFHSEYSAESAVYVTVMGWILRGALDFQSYQLAWQHMVERHTILRTAFIQKESLQAVLRDAQLPIEYHDWRALEDSEKDARLAALVQSERQNRFDYAKPPLMRLFVIATRDDEHRVLFTHHHVILDGWSVPILLHEVFASYDAYRAGRQPQLGAAKPYRDYIAWLQTQNPAESEGYWRNRLSGFERATPLGVDKLRTAAPAPRNRHAQYRCRLAVDAAVLEAFARQHRLTVSNLLQGAWATLLSRYSGSIDVAYGVVLSSRPAELDDIERRLGLFINTLPARFTVRADQRVLPWLEELRTQHSELVLHQYSSLAEVQAWSDVPAGAPLFESIFTVENFPTDALEHAGDRTLVVDGLHAHEQPHYPINMIVGIDSSVSATVYFDGQRFSQGAIARMVRHFERLLGELIAKFDARLGDLDLLADEERQQLLVDWNDTARDYAGDPCVHGLFSAQAQRTPDAVAVLHGDKALTYGELEKRSNQLGRYLRELGVGKEVVVGLCMERSMEMIVAVLGILKAGGAYLPLDPTSPIERLVFTVSDANARLVLTTTSVRERFTEVPADTLCIDALETELRSLSNERLEGGADSQNLAYVIYTSGSTGKPKGAMLQHANVLNYVHWAADAYRVAEGCGAPINTPLPFDATVTSLLVPLCAGSSITLLDEENEIDALAGLLKQGKAYSLVKLTPGHLEALEQGSPEAIREDAARVLVIGGEALRDSHVRAWRQRAPGTRLINEYGPTETTVGCCVYEVDDASRSEDPVPIGRPIANTALYVLDDRLEPVPVGVTGELYIGGRGLARGYVNRAALTAERFIANPFREGERIYRSGDLARYREDGVLEYAGRVDHQVKIRGYRIELGEIEATLSSCEGVRQALVLAREDEPGQKRLVAYIAGDALTDPAELKIRLGRSLPEYMVPSVFVVLDSLPVTANGKVDRSALPAPEERQSLIVYVAPRTAVEEGLAAIWSHVLRVDRIGIQDNFFDLGGHSLHATRVIARIREMFEIELTLATLFEAPMLSDLAGRVEIAQREQKGMALVSFEPPARPARIPLSFAQERLWFIEQLGFVGPAYNIARFLQIQGELNVEALKQSFAHLIRRHESLRTRFETIAGQTAQVIEPAVAPLFRESELTHLTYEEQQSEVRRLLNEESQRVFDLTTGPLLRLVLIKLSASQHVLLFTLHHIISDGWSCSVLVRELSTLYQAYSQARAPFLPKLSIQYADFAVWQRERFRDDVLDAQLAYWKQQLGGAPPMLDFPTDRPRTNSASYQGSRTRFTVSADLLARLSELGRGEGATLFMVLLAGFQWVLAKWSGQQDIVVGTPFSGRPYAETEGVVGLFLNMLALRTDVSGELTFRELLKRVKGVALAAYAHQDVPFETVVAKLQPERHLARQPIFQIVFALDNFPVTTTELAGATINEVGIENGTTKFDLTFSAYEGKTGVLRCSIEYARDLFDLSTIDRLTNHFVRLLEVVAERPEARLREVSLLGEGEQRQLEEWNAAQTSYPQGRCVHELVSAQALERPDAEAVSFEGERLTYGELERRANRLAHHLRELGVGPEVVVGLCMERSVSMVVGLLGIMKAGGAYLPLDPHNPEERLSFMLSDAAAPIVLTQTAWRERLKFYAGETLCVEELEEQLVATQPDTVLDSGVGAQNLAYVIYTSGSTGTPKGVGVSHYNVVRLFQSTESLYHFDSSDVWSLFHSYAFDFSVWEIFGALLYGGRVVVVSLDVARTPDRFIALLKEEGVTVLNQTPSSFQRLLLDDHAAELDSCKLRVVIFGGEALEQETVRSWYDNHEAQAATLVNMYGITEGTVHVTYQPMSASLANNPATRSPIGRPLGDLQLYLLDSQLERVPVGVVGELCFGGAGLARGYLKRPGLTAERFIASPFKEGERLYRSGDLARYREDGNLEYLGRADHQVKIRGFRIELGEIEAALLGHEGIEQAVVLAREDEPGQKRLVAYVVGAAVPAVAQLRAYLGQTLPEYMVPAAFVTLASLPLTVNGKVDRKALPAPEGRPQIEEFVPPRTPVEEVLAAIWAQVLGVPRVGIHDNFFELGGDSIRSLTILSLARERGLELSLQDMFRYQTISALLNAPRSEEVTPARPASAPFGLLGDVDRAVLPEGVEDAYPMSHLQAGMLYHMQMTIDDYPDYHNVNSHFIHLRQPFDLAAFRAAFGYVVARHPILRTSFEFAGFSEPMQLVHRTVSASVEAEDLRHLSPAQQNEVIRACIEQQGKQTFDLSRPPLVRLKVHRLLDNACQLTLTECHALLDGWSLHTVWTELFEAYFAFSAGRDPSHEPLSGTYRDFIALERETLSSSDSRAFWDTELDGVTALQLPRREQSSPSTAGWRVQRQATRIEADLLAALERVATAAAVPLKSVLLAAHLRVLALLTNRTDVLTALTSHGRLEEADGEKVCGLFLNNLPLRLRMSGGSWIDLIKAVFEAEWRMLPHRRLPYAAIQRQRGSHSPLSDTSFTYINFHVMERLQRSDNFLHGLVDVDRVPTGRFTSGRSAEPTNYVLSVGFYMDPYISQLVLSIDHRTADFHEGLSESVGQYYLAALGAIAADASQRYESTEILSPAERQQLQEWNATETLYPQERCVHELVSAQALERPDAEAVSFEGERLTYGELERRANRLAHHLRELGVGPEVVVGLCMERSVSMVVGLLGIMKAGGAYLPLDPHNPEERLSFMLGDAEAPIVLTQTAWREQLKSYAGLTLCVEELEEKLVATQPDTVLDSGVGAQNLAYVIYTSGSTGMPKGAMNTHEGIRNRLQWMQQRYELGDGDAVLQKTASTFDVSVWELLWPLMVGARMVLARPEGQRDPGYLAEVITTEAVTTMHFVPSMLAGFFADRSLNLEGCRQSLRRVVCSGEALPRELVEEFAERLKGVRLENLYGPTEASIDVTAWECGKDAGEGPIPIGRPIANTHIYVLDEWLEPVPVGVAGELYIGGVGLARGYLQRPGLTAERFMASPFKEGERVYRSGDLARYREDGNLEYLGRVDHQVKIRGFRIELGEIEAALLGHEEIEQAVVLAREDEPGQKRLVAYVVGAAVPAVAQLRAHLGQTLPEYMVPAAFVTLPSLPLTVNGKVDRKALPAPEGRPQIEEFVPPRTPVEEALAAIWAQVLGVERVGIHDNFFELGGHSLAAIALKSRIKRDLGADVALTQLLAVPTVAGLVEHLPTFELLTTARLAQASDASTYRAATEELLEYEEGEIA